MADYAIVGGTLAYLILGFLPWFEYSDFSGFDADDLGFDPGFADNISGFTFSSLVGSSFVLSLLAAVWALLPAFTDLKLGSPALGHRRPGRVRFPADAVRVDRVAPPTTSASFRCSRCWSPRRSRAFAFLSLLPELRNRPALPGGLSNAARWAGLAGPRVPIRRSRARRQDGPPTRSPDRPHRRRPRQPQEPRAAHPPPGPGGAPVLTGLPPYLPRRPTGPADREP